MNKYIIIKGDKKDYEVKNCEYNEIVEVANKLEKGDTSYFIIDYKNGVTIFYKNITEKKEDGIMKKEKRAILGKDNYLLGINNDGVKVWLEGATWDCGWYWGFGYVEEYNNNYSDIEAHQHFDGLFLEKDIYNSFKAYFKETTLKDNEIWKLLELMKQFYTIKEYGEMMHRNGAHITSVKDSILKQHDEDNKKEYERINKIILPKLFNEIYTLLGGAK